jgi:hypothetical protein
LKWKEQIPLANGFIRLQRCLGRLVSFFYGDRNCLQQAKDKSKNIAEKKTGYKRFQSYQCWLLTLLSMGVTELRVRGFNYFSEKEMS